MANQNTPEYLDKIKTRLFENLRMIPHAPGVQMQGNIYLWIAHHGAFLIYSIAILYILKIESNTLRSCLR